MRLSTAASVAVLALSSAAFAQVTGTPSSQKGTPANTAMANMTMPHGTATPASNAMTGDDAMSNDTMSNDMAPMTNAAGNGM